MLPILQGEPLGTEWPHNMELRLEAVTSQRCSVPALGPELRHIVASGFYPLQEGK